MKYQIGDRVAWKDGQRHFVGNIVRYCGDIEGMPVCYDIVINTKKRHFVRAEQELTFLGHYRPEGPMIESL